MHSTNNNVGIHAVFIPPYLVDVPLTLAIVDQHTYRVSATQSETDSLVDACLLVADRRSQVQGPREEQSDYKTRRILRHISRRRR